MHVEKAYYSSRKRASLELAREAASAEARLIHYDLAGRYGLKAMLLQSFTVELVDSLPPSIYAGRAPR
jgi:hypothetical protein